MTRTLGVVGTGLIGTSVALAATAAGYRVVLTDRDSGNVTLAVARGAGQPWKADDSPDLVVVAVPPSAVSEVVTTSLNRYPSAVITDVCSVKGAVLNELGATGEELGRFVGGHPMAGREISGPAAASAELFRGRPWLITPTGQTADSSTSQVVTLVEDLGAVPRVVPARTHDQSVALVSHLPQVVASLVAARLEAAPEGLIDNAGQGLRDVVRLGASDPELWNEILQGNSEELVPLLEQLRDDLDALTAGLSGDGAQVSDLLAAGNRGVERLPAKHGGAAAEYALVSVEVQDTPGALGALFVAAGEAGINLEDVRVEHLMGRLTAVVHLAVMPSAAQPLKGELMERGWLVVE